jgi:hypothetical protein
MPAKMTDDWSDEETDNPALYRPPESLQDQFARNAPGEMPSRSAHDGFHVLTRPS